MEMRAEYKTLLLTFSDWFCDSHVYFTWCRTCGRLLILSIIFANTSLSVSSSITNAPLVSPTDLIPCPADSSLFFKGNCVSCAEPYYYSNPVGNYRSAADHAVTFSNTSTADLMFMCPVSEQDYMEMRNFNLGKDFLNGNVLRVVTIERHPLVKIVDNEFTGVVFELLSALRMKYNFTSKIFFPSDGKWGSVVKNGTWNGMVGHVLRNEADMGAAGFSVTLDRAKVIDFSMSFHQEPTGILIPAPKAGNKLTILIRPLNAEVWLAVFTTVCVLVPSLFVMHIVSLQIRRMAGDDDQITNKPVNMSRLIVELIQFIIGSFVQEGMVSPVNKTSRFLVVIWWFLTLVLANVYVGYMVSFLSAPKLYDLVDSLEGLLHQNVLKWTYRKNTAIEDLFQSNTSAIYRAIGMGARETDLAATDMAGVEKVLSGHFAFLKEKSFLDVAIGNDFDEAQHCRVTMARETFFTVGLALVVQKGCAFLELLNTEIQNTITTGLMAKWKGIHWPRNLWCINAAQYIVSTQPKARKLTLDDCQGSYFLLLCGLSLASIAYIIEIIKDHPWKKFLKRRATSDDNVNDDDHNLNGYKIIVIPVKEDIYHKIHNDKNQHNLFKTTRKGVIDKI